MGGCNYFKKLLEGNYSNWANLIRVGKKDRGRFQQDIDSARAEMIICTRSISKDLDKR